MALYFAPSEILVIVWRSGCELYSMLDMPTSRTDLHSKHSTKSRGIARALVEADVRNTSHTMRTAEYRRGATCVQGRLRVARDR